MKSRKPQLNSKKKICIICEGFEEYEYIEKLVSLNVWSGKYKFNLVNAESNGKIPARYQDAYAADSNDIIFVFCDTDQKPFEDYQMIKSKIDKVHGVDNASDKLVIYANPCTMQIILLHFANVKLTSHKKSENKMAIRLLTNVTGYRAKRKQRDKLFSQINRENYETMLLYLDELLEDENKMGSSNFKKYISYFTSEDIKWIEKINESIEECL